MCSELPNRTNHRHCLAAKPSHKEKKAQVSEPRATAPPPEFFRLPPKGGDPHFGLTRSFYYAGESRGYWKLVRLRERGKIRGVTLVPFDAVAAFIRSQCEEVSKKKVVGK
jgi:hypothetical protein